LIAISGAIAPEIAIKLALPALAAAAG